MRKFSADKFFSDLRRKQTEPKPDGTPGVLNGRPARWWNGYLWLREEISETPPRSSYDFARESGSIESRND